MRRSNLDRCWSRRTLDDRAAWHPEQSLTVEEAIVASTVNPAGWREPSEIGDASCPDVSPIWSCSTVIRSVAGPTSWATLEVVATMVAAAGSTIHPPGRAGNRLH